MKYVIFFLMVVSVTGCTYNKADDLFKTTTTNTCDTTIATYAATVVPILSANCYRCHDVNNYVNKGSGYRFDVYQPQLRNMAQNGSLVKAITHAAGVIPMPYDGGKISDCEINKIKAWVNRGALNN